MTLVLLVQQYCDYFPKYLNYKVLRGYKEHLNSRDTCYA